MKKEFLRMLVKMELNPAKAGWGYWQITNILEVELMKPLANCRYK